MKKTILTMTFCAVAALSAPAFAAEMMECNNENMVKVSQEAMKIADQAVMATAMQDLAAATTAMAAGKSEECAMSLDKVAKAAKMK